MAPTLSALAAAAGCGVLIGSIRQWHEQTTAADPTTDFGGVRTHTLWALLGCLAAGFPWALPAALTLVASHLIAQRFTAASAHRAPGGTGFAAALLTVLVGALTNTGDLRAAALVTALTVVLLGFKQPIHDWTRRFTPADIRAALQFAAITGIVLPLVPNRAIDPWGLFNPFKIWLMVVFISGLGFAGYVAMRLLGAKAGITVTALLGGLASSTASTLAFARQSRAEPALANHHAFATVTACTVMLPRVALAIALFSPALAWAVAAPLAFMAAPALVFAAWFW
ncbi:MAG: MgtC/SapB family protein, partial [Burkholderiales bacterium]|nr:MgtC/SapB family protein [Opitutaceae bacterium]